MVESTYSPGSPGRPEHSGGPGVPAPLAERLTTAPLPVDAVRGSARLADLLADARLCDPAASERLSGLVEQPAVAALLIGVLDGSPYLAGVARREPGLLADILSSPPERTIAAALSEARGAVCDASSLDEAMAQLRRMKQTVAMTTALADLGGAWPMTQVTRALSEAADCALQSAVGVLFRRASQRGDWLADDPPAAAASSGYFVLAMGKHGAFELNYSSDIDLIVFYDPAKAKPREGLELQPFLVRLTRDLVRLMQERTPQGYVFRTDLRLRPDAGATQVALSTDAAHHYYESFGQNWERAAFIKARVVAGDMAAGQQFLGELQPFIWRKHLDFAAIADVHAMKRQIHAHRGFGEVKVAGHNIKLGRGGIREIEFFAQTQQLIAGGRQVELRTPATLHALSRLVGRGWIAEATRAELAEAYVFLRGVEHRLQMVADEQTHELPDAPAELWAFARFCGYETFNDFSAALTSRLATVERHYAALFEDTPELTRTGVNMVFAGASDDPVTIETLQRLGYTTPSQVLATVRGWHHGRYPAVRTARARERLTEVQPLLIEALAATANPDGAFLAFDRFLSHLPAGVQLFSMLRANPRLLAVIADIMGTAPRLARILGRRSRLLDALIDPRVIGELPTTEALADLVAGELSGAHDLQERLDRARIVGQEQMFLVGARLLTGMIGARRAGGAYARVAETLIRALAREVEHEMAAAHGTVEGGGAVILAMGKLGGLEMTATSDLDLILVYDHADGPVQSNGPRPLAPSQYYGRYTQRLISALAAPTAEGSLFDVDMRLRPSGQKGPVATSLASFIDYQHREAWTWEHLALTRARVIAGPPGLAARVEQTIRDVLCRPRDRQKLVADVRDMRDRVFKEKGSADIWDLKQVRGGLVDLEFTAQFLQLAHGCQMPGLLETNTLVALQKLEVAGLLTPAQAETLTAATRLVHDLTQILRLCLDGPLTGDNGPEGLKRLLVRVAGADGFAALEATLRERLADSHAVFEALLQA